MAELELRNLNKQFGRVRAVDDLSLVVHDGEFVTLLGPSGCGKSTTLNLIAGLEKATSGDIYLDGQRITELPPNERGMAMVFQNYALYPHMTVSNNISFSLRLRGVPKAAIEEKVEYVSRVLDISQLLKRKPAQLSGGQQQRVAVARALAKEPEIFLFDEPLSNLDAALRARTRTEIKRLHLALGATTVFVTHDQEEAMTMSDRIAVMRDGRLIQYDGPEDVYRRPNSVYIATFIGKPSMNILAGNLEAGDDVVTLTGPGGGLRWSSRQALRLERPWQGAAMVGVRAEDARLSDGGDTSSVDGLLGAEVALVEPIGSDSFVEVWCGEWRIVARVDPVRRFRRGETVRVELPADKVHIFEAASGQRLNA